ncbi:MAG: hypothetical protein F6K00_27040 [Leptolyngbya sp. SIOISBB]|nr:hypothetical protein [Leptolyngbya sp. SIOISBB]
MQRVSSKRIELIKTVAVIAAVCLTVYDAYVSYQGFRQLQLPNQAPIVLALLILIVQLASGAIQQLGMNPFRGIGGSGPMDFVWIWVLASVYVIDVGSNAIAFGAGPYFSFWRLIRLDIDGIGMGLVILMLAGLLTFGDEILLRLVDRLVVGSRANEASAKKAGIDTKAYNRYLHGYEQRAIAQADVAGQHASVDFEWLRQGGTDV